MKYITLIMLCLFLGACVYSQHHKAATTGTAVSAAQLQEIELGKTTKQWVLANLGIPQQTHQEADGLEVFEYRSELTKTSHASFIFLFNVDSEEAGAKKVTRILFRQDLVEAVVNN